MQNLVKMVSGLALLMGAGMIWLATDDPVGIQAEEAKKEVHVEAVESDMHELMEYLFEPSYLRLKTAMASEPKERADWKGIKADSLVLAEGANLRNM